MNILLEKENFKPIPHTEGMFIYYYRLKSRGIAFDLITDKEFNHFVIGQRSFNRGAFGTQAKLLGWMVSWEMVNKIIDEKR